MDDQGRSSAAREHRESVSASVRLSMAGDNDLSVVVTPSPDSIDPTPASGRHSMPSYPTPLDDNTLQRPSSMHSRPSSIAKPLTQNPPRPRSDVVASESDLQRNLDISMQAEAPYEGPSNPSHPYQMYPQRAMSISTLSAGTPAPDGPDAGSRGPAHPYGLYPQSTPTADVAQPDDIPVGFPGLTNAFPRRLGLAGDEAGSVVGSVAPSEELPPYTRYPDSGAPKAAGPPQITEDPSAPEARPRTAPQPTSSSNIAPISGAGGIGLATRDPEFASTSSEPGSPHLSARSFTSDGSHHDINTAGASATEKPTRKPWQQQATKKLWGIIPYWAVALLGVVLILMGVILGAVIGTFLSKDQGPPKGGKPDRPRFGDANSTQEVTFLKTVPDDLPDLETGAWGLLPLMVSQAPSTCFEIPDQSQAWTCNAPMSLYDVDVQDADDAPPTSAYRLRFAPSKNSTAFTKYAWGTRSPAVPEHETLRLVSDPSEPGLGPAWWVRREYNKTVVLPEDRISPSTAPSERRRSHLSDAVLAFAKRGEGGDASGKPEEGGDQKGKPGQGFPPPPGAKDGDKAWICTWPDTVLEVFLYPRKNNTFSAHATDSPSGFPDFPAPTKPPTSTGDPSDGEATPTETSGTPEATGSASLTGGGPDPDWAMPPFPPMLPPYPQVVKVSERRVDGLADAGAYCEQVEITEGGKSQRPVVDGDGRAVRIAVPEQAGPGPEGKESWVTGGGLEGRDKPPPGDCGCVWMVE